MMLYRIDWPTFFAGFTLGILMWLILFIVSTVLFVKSLKRRIPLQMILYLLVALFTGYMTIGRIILVIKASAVM